MVAVLMSTSSVALDASFLASAAAFGVCAAAALFRSVTAFWGAVCADAARARQRAARNASFLRVFMTYILALTSAGECIRPDNSLRNSPMLPGLRRYHSVGSISGPSFRRMDCAVQIGTSGWHYRHWCGPFYPEKLPAARMLEFYA